MITIKDLDLVRSIATSGSLTAAAKLLHISQSATSQRLASLHTRLDVKLVERQDGLMQLTPAGERVFQASKVVASELQSTLADVNKIAQQRSEQLRITTQCYTCYRWLPFVINSMRADYPLLNVDVVPEATDAPYDALRNKEIDVALVSNPSANSELVEHALFSDELFAVMSPTHELATEKFLTPKKFSGQTLILYTGTSHAIEEEVLSPANVNDYRIIQVRITEAIIELARSGQGIAVIAGWALDDIVDSEELVAVRITKRGFQRSWRAVVATDYDEDHIEAFLRSVRNVGAAIQNRAWRRTLRQQAST